MGYGSYFQSTQYTIVKLLQALYSIVSASVSINGEESDMFNLQTGFKPKMYLIASTF